MKAGCSLMKKLILISGTMGIGKSTITEELSKQSSLFTLTGIGAG